MKHILSYTILVLIIVSLIFFGWWFWPSPIISLKPVAPKPVAPQPVILKPFSLKLANFSKLPGWKKNDPRISFSAFQLSCQQFLKQNPERAAGSQYIDLKVKDWLPACKAAALILPTSKKAARKFFEKWFTPVQFYEDKPVKGLFTGYYLPLVKGSLTPTKTFDVPIYDVPNNLITVELGLFDPELAYHRKLVGRLEGKKLIPFFSRQEINAGAVKKYAPVLLWINSEVDRLFIEIEGSGVVELPDGSQVYIGYNGENGAPYKAVAAVLINQGVMTRDNASMQRIRDFFRLHPEQVRPVLDQNKSFVFFTLLKQKAALGAQGLALTPGYSLAVDRKWIPLGTPLWLNTTRPARHAFKDEPFQQLMIAQDTGGAIRGPVRGDVYWGAGEEAAYIAGHMKNTGYYWLLLPKQSIATLKIHR